MELSRKRSNSADPADIGEAGPSRPTKSTREGEESSRPDMLSSNCLSYQSGRAFPNYSLCDLYSRDFMSYSLPYSQLPFSLTAKLNWMMSSLASNYDSNEKYFLQRALQYAEQTHRSAFSPVKARSSCVQKTGNEHLCSVLEKPFISPSLNRNTLRQSFGAFPAEDKDAEESSADKEVACHIYGILSLPGSKETRYPITASELKRRVNSPECLNKVDMISYVRLAKTSARELLEKHNITTHLQTRRSRHTILSKMCEAECTALADGIFSLEMRYFPFKFIAFKMAEALKCPLYSSDTLTHMKIKDIEITQSLLVEFCCQLQNLMGTDELKTFELISHTFGLRHIVNTLEFFITYFEELKKALAASVARYK